jgi:hypothetical protein
VSDAPRLTDRRGERFRGAIATGAANCPPSAKRVGARFGRPQDLGRRCSSTFLLEAKAGTPSLTIARAGELRFHLRPRRLTRVGFTLSENLDRLPVERRAGSGSSGGVWTPQPRRAPGQGGLCRSPSLLSRARALLACAPSERAPLALIERSPPSGLRVAPAGAPRHTRRWGEGSAAARRGKESPRLVSCSVRARGSLRTRAERRAGGPASQLERPCENPAGAPRRHLSAESVVPWDSMTFPSLLRRRSSRRTRVGRAFASIAETNGIFGPLRIRSTKRMQSAAGFVVRLLLKPIS